MDEVGAALDFRKVSIIANYIKERARNSQFIVIPLREHMFGLADLLVGFYEPQDVPQPVALNPGRFDVEKPFLQVKDANPKSSPTRAIAAITRGASDGTGSWAAGSYSCSDGGRDVHQSCHQRARPHRTQ